MFTPVLTERAPAKVNLYLHIHGRRADGYHLVDSGAVFASLADTLEIAPADALTLKLEGDFADAAGAGDGNLVLRAARLLQEKTGTHQGAQMRLTKNIPVGAGFGGGSADAAAALRGLNHFWQLGLSATELEALAPALGADVAMCVTSQPVRVQGIGEQLSPLPWELPPLHAVLVHPRIPLLTSEVYQTLRESPLPTHEALSEVKGVAPLSFKQTIATLQAQQNDLEAPAHRVSATVDAVLAALRGTVPSPELVRMTGSGACCFALYETPAQAAEAASILQVKHPGWFIEAVKLN